MLPDRTSVGVAYTDSVAARSRRFPEALVAWVASDLYFEAAAIVIWCSRPIWSSAP